MYPQYKTFFFNPASECTIIVILKLHSKMADLVVKDNLALVKAIIVDSLLFSRSNRMYEPVVKIPTDSMPTKNKNGMPHV